MTWTASRPLPADYPAMWELIRAKVWAAHYDLAELRGDPNKGAGIPKGTSRALTKLRLEVTWMLREAGYARDDIADFLYISGPAVRMRVRLWQKRLERGSSPPPPPER